VASQATAVEKGLTSAAPGVAPSLIALWHQPFDFIESFQAWFGVHLKEIVAGVANYTNMQPIIQLSQIVI